MISRESDLVDGIAGGQEIGLLQSNANAEVVANTSNEVFVIPVCSFLLYNFDFSSQKFC